MDAPSTTFQVLLTAVFLAAPVTAAALLFTTAPYGRHSGRRSGPGLPTRLGWVVMECPSVLAFAHFFFRGPNALHAVPLVLVTLGALFEPALPRLQMRSAVHFLATKYALSLLAAAVGCWILFGPTVVAVATSAWVAAGGAARAISRTVARAA